jgi:protein-disulfide isomerase
MTSLVPKLARALLIVSFVLFAFSAVNATACTRPLPLVIRDEMSVTPRGKATIVFFTDFQCPFCRKTHEALAPVVEQREGKVRIVLRHVPLQRHPDARTAARAAVCVEKLAPANAERYANALFAARDLSEASVAGIATAHGVENDVLQQCVSDKATDARIERDTAMFDSIGGDGVPLLYVGSARLDGMQTQSSLETAVDAAIEEASR